MLFALPGHAAEDAEPAACRTQATTVEMIECADWQLRRADRQLNEAYAVATAALDEEGKRLLRKAQRAWIAFRDAECLRARDEARGGTMAAVLEIACLTDLTERRVVDLVPDAPAAAKP